MITAWAGGYTRYASWRALTDCVPNKSSSCNVGRGTTEPSIRNKQNSLTF